MSPDVISHKSKVSPEFVTYTASKSEIEAAISNGATHLLLEDSKISARCNENDFDNPTLEKLVHLAEYARKIDPEIKLSIVCDIVIHNHHEALLLELVETLKKSTISTVRIADLGLIEFFQNHAPHISLHFHTETGNMNVLSSDILAQSTERQILSNELPHNIIEDWQKTTRAQFEVQVFGPMLIQYSHRRYLNGLESMPKTKNSPIISTLAQDMEYPGRYYKFLDTPNGHFMFLYFHRCLIKMLPELMACNLSGWLFDGRGENSNYLETALKIFRVEKERFESSQTEHEVKNWKLQDESWQHLSEASPFPLRPGFFRVNKTDQDIQNPNLSNHIHAAGIVLDASTKSDLVIECKSPLSLGDELINRKKQRKEKHYSITQIKAMDDSKIETAKSGELIKIKHQSGVLYKSLVFKKQIP